MTIEQNTLQHSQHAFQGWSTGKPQLSRSDILSNLDWHKGQMTSDAQSTPYGLGIHAHQSIRHSRLRDQPLTHTYNTQHKSINAFHQCHRTSTIHAACTATASELTASIKRLHRSLLVLLQGLLLVEGGPESDSNQCSYSFYQQQ